MTIPMAHDHVTEAACLLQQGASYRRRVGLQPAQAPADPIFAGFKQGAFSLYFGDAPIYHFDLEGRWQRAFLDRTHYLKGLDATVHAVDRVREGANLVLKRRTLADDEADDLDERVRSTALDLIAGIDADRLGRVEPVSPKAIPLQAQDLRDFLAQIGSWDAAAWLAHRERFRAEYRPPIFLPPECQNAVVLQATPGDATGVGFARHAREVATLWGRRLLQSRVIFLAGNDVLHQPVREVATLLSTVAQTFPIAPRARGRTQAGADAEEKPCFDGVHAYLNDFAMTRPDGDGWRELAALGLVRISLGVESGDALVRKMYQKGWADDELRATIVDLKAAGLGVSLLTIVGAGGAPQAASHVEPTVRLVASLELGAGDFVFLLDEKEMGELHTAAPGISHPLEGQTWLDQQARLKEGLAPLKKRGVKVLPYTLDKQWT
jgi:hypothetical protein